MSQEIQVPPLPPQFFDQGPAPMEVAVAVVVIVAAVGSIVILWTLVRGLIRKWSAPPAADVPAVQELQQSVRRLQAEVGELQERLDFAERVLTSRSEAERLERGRS
jgi:flagellar biosynthesis/type III secretory pathway M-ring protein FliF/YscJ